MPFFSFVYSSKSVFVLRNDEYVSGGDRCDISKSKDEVILIYHIGGYLLSNKFVEDSFLTHKISLYLIYRYKSLLYNH